ncbi:hypothetical protein HF576_09915 [Microbacterium sp. CFH 90308]|uniref:RES domain-containing protein n=1 Tax=Microbacterium salsuginis TaxID=2722803 RepID=A0ABX1KAW5_9MICO|nr:hypothetical protein [Microbacterium sp. CFH 90308]NLP84167.1 hypothetical protein [Microbacterium sp. CFH 90308]
MTDEATPSQADIPPAQVVWRRFDTRDPAHYDNNTIDESSGASRLKGGALRFDDDGCSVFREDVLRSLGLAPISILSRQHSGLAYAACSAINGFESGMANDSNQEFMVVGDPLEPEPAYNPAHTLITHPGEYASKTKRRQAIHQLARRVFKTIEVSG